MNAGSQLLIEAAVVNHNTSAFCELMLRSLFAAHLSPRYLHLRVFDNASTDEMTALRQYAAEMGVPILPSGFTQQAPNNSHGEVLRNFVLANPQCTHYLFLDADTVFTHPDTIPRLAGELDTQPDAFGINPRMPWDGRTPYDLENVPLVYGVRIHPFCALIRNTPLFRRVVEEVGLSCARYLWAENEEYLDTFTLMTKTMRTHGLRHHLGEVLAIHFFSVSYVWDDEETRAVKLRHRDDLLAGLRAHGTLPSV